MESCSPDPKSRRRRIIKVYPREIEPFLVLDKEARNNFNTFFVSQENEIKAVTIEAVLRIEAVDMIEAVHTI